MRKIKKYKKQKGSKKQVSKLEVINKFQDDIAEAFFNYKNTKTRLK